jgi:nitrate/TMAO reductase-like tetraheme cytochrome c subunit
MNDHSAQRETPRAFLRLGFAIAAVAAALALLPVGAPAQEALSDDDRLCLSCHGAEGMEKTLADGSTLPLHVPADMFAKSVHGAIGCAGCHADIDPAAHPPSNKDIESARSYAVAATEACSGCHAEMFEQWETSIHAALVRAGNPQAPICSDCHSPHAVIEDAAAQLDQSPCKDCHAEISTAYLGSMHAKARRSSDESHAPLCSGCHSAHDVQPTMLGEGPKAACSGCHADALEAHRKWLPNAGLHFAAVSCPACHSPGAQRKVDLLLVDGEDQAIGTEQIGVPLLEASARSDGKGLDALTLWNLLQTFNREGLGGKTALRGRLKVRTGPQAHRLADKSQALSDCQTCHSAGSEPFQSVTISLAGPTGQRVSVGASAEVLSSAISLDSVSGFYAIGGTRIKILDILLAVAFLAGLAVPIGHMTMGWIFKRYLLAPHRAGGGKQPAGGNGSHSG